MTTILIILLVLLGWLALSVVVGLILGPILHRNGERYPVAPNYMTKGGRQ